MKEREQKGLKEQKRLTRRDFLKIAGASTMALSGLSPAIGWGQPKKLTKLEYFFTIAGTASAPLMAVEKGLYQAEGIEIVLRGFPSGTTALQSWQAGAGNVILTGDLPALTYFFQNPEDYRMITPWMRSATYYGAVVKASIKDPKDLKGKTVATRVGSTGSFFIHQYLTKNGIDPKEVKVLNLETSQMIPALDRGDIDGFFIWEPHLKSALLTSGKKVRLLTSGVGYLNGYSPLGARPKWINENKELLIRFLRAMKRATEAVTSDPKLAAKLLQKQYGLNYEEGVWLLETPGLVGWSLGFDEMFYEDFSNEFRWAKAEKILPANSQLDFSKWCYLEGVRALDPKLARTPPPPVK